MNGPLRPRKSLYNIRPARSKLAEYFPGRSNISVASFFGTVAHLEGEDVCAHIVVEWLDGVSASTSANLPDYVWPR